MIISMGGLTRSMLPPENVSVIKYLRSCLINIWKESIRSTNNALYFNKVFNLSLQFSQADYNAIKSEQRSYKKDTIYKLY